MYFPINNFIHHNTIHQFMRFEDAKSSKFATFDSSHFQNSTACGTSDFCSEKLENRVVIFVKTLVLLFTFINIWAEIVSWPKGESHLRSFHRSRTDNKNYFKLFPKYSLAYDNFNF